MNLFGGFISVPIALIAVVQVSHAAGNRHFAVYNVCKQRFRRGSHFFVAGDLGVFRHGSIEITRADGGPDRCGLHSYGTVGLIVGKVVCVALLLAAFV